MFSFSNLSFDFYGFHSKKLKITHLIFELARRRKTIERLCLGTIGLIVTPLGNLMLKLAHLFKEPSCSTEILYCLINWFL